MAGAKRAAGARHKTTSAKPSADIAARVRRKTTSAKSGNGSAERGVASRLDRIEAAVIALATGNITAARKALGIDDAEE